MADSLIKPRLLVIEGRTRLPSVHANVAPVIITKKLVKSSVTRDGWVATNFRLSQFTPLDPFAVVTVTLICDLQPSGVIKTLGQEFQAPVAARCGTLSTNNVLFVFPRSSPPKYLWANIETLSRASPVWAKTFDSGFAEASSYLPDVKQWSTACDEALDGIFSDEQRQEPIDRLVEDSDDDEAHTSQQKPNFEAEAGLLRNILSAASVESDEEQEREGTGSLGISSIRYVVVKDTPYRTYRAIFTALLSGRITFARLSSTSSVRAIGSLSASPKSVYRLAHQLELHEIACLALEAYLEQLDADNVVQELFTDVCALYPELKEAAMAAVQREWAEVQKKGKLDLIDAMIDKEDGVEPAQIAKLAVELLKRCKQSPQ